MKKLMIFILILISPYIIFVLIRLVTCKPDKSVYAVSLPLAQAVVKYAEKYGRPKDLKEVENLPYELIPCAKKPKNFVCKSYYFVEDGKFYTAYFEGLPPELEDLHYIWMDVSVEYNHTVNRYAIYSKDNVKSINDLTVHAYRSPVGICAHFSF